MNKKLIVLILVIIGFGAFKIFSSSDAEIKNSGDEDPRSNGSEIRSADAESSPEEGQSQETTSKSRMATKKDPGNSSQKNTSNSEPTVQNHRGLDKNITELKNISDHWNSEVKIKF